MSRPVSGKVRQNTANRLKPFPLQPINEGRGFSCPPHLSSLMEAWRELNSLGESTQTKAAQLRSDPNFTPVGRRSQLLDWARQSAGPTLNKAFRAMEDASSEVEKLRGQISATAIDKTDVAGAMLRWQAREHLRALPDAKRNAQLATGSLDPLYALAILEAPPEMSGVTPPQRERLRDTAMAALHPEAAAKLQSYREAMEAVMAAEEAAVKTMTDEPGGLQKADLDTIMGNPTASGSRDERSAYFAKHFGLDEAPAADEPDAAA